MKRKNAFSLFLALLLTFALPLGAFAEEPAVDTELEGFVTELVEGGFIMEDKDLGSVMLNVDETTVLDGVLADGEIEVGQYVFVTYDGRMTRSIPPQAHADRVGCYVLRGSVGELMDIGVLLTGDELFGDVIVRPGENELPPLYVGMPATVYYNGVMALSLPGQVTASHVIVPELSGVVSEKDDEGFTLTDESGETYRVLVNEETAIFEKLPEIQDDAALIADGQTEADEGEATENAEDEETEGEAAADEPEEAELPEVDEAVETELPEAEEAADEPEPEQPAADEAATEAEAADEEPEAMGLLSNEEAADLDAELEEDTHLPPVSWGDGDTVTVYFSGIMTRSIPARLSALGIAVIR